MKTGIVRAFLILAALVLFTGLGFYGYRWWASRQRMRALSTYLMQTSPVVRRLPPDTRIYMNFYNLRRVHAGLQNTRLYGVISHWLDTGMGAGSKNTPNPLMGGMLEKTLLNVLGEEMAIAMCGDGNHEPDLVAVARLASGSDFVLRLALSQNKKLGRVPVGDETVYVIRSSNPWYPQLFLMVDSDFAYMSSSQERFASGAFREGTGPEFLSTDGVDSIPESTFFFFKSADPRLFILAYSEGHRYHLQLRANSLISGPLPVPGRSETSVLDMVTNIPRLIRQPAAAFGLHSVQGTPVPTAMLAFGDEERAERYAMRLRGQLTVGLPPESIEEDTTESYSCLRFPYKGGAGMLCRQGALVLALGGMLDPAHVFNDAGVTASRKQPLTVTLQVRSENLADFRSMLDQQDWSRFSSSGVFYFLSCIRGVSGGIDAGQNEIVAEIE